MSVFACQRPPGRARHTIFFQWRRPGPVSPGWRSAAPCTDSHKRCKGVDRATALRALTEGVHACVHCRPDADSDLGYLDG
ncbi:DUF6233 domain-containing protein [Streptomyces sp. NPDC001276]|uniref:DUF6233 domain-containing protein n=1 Tax=Streptomyces sp. NPDC001276 TaxID=3364555 RepID=UPI00369331B0